MLKDDSGNWVEDQDMLKGMKCTFFQNLYTLDVLSASLFPRHGSSLLLIILTWTGMIFLFHQVKFDERSLIWSCGKLRSRWLSRWLFQSQWNLVWRQLYEEVGKVMLGCRLTESLRGTLNTLIPKISHPISIANFRPIAL